MTKQRSWDDLAALQSVLDSLDDPLFVKDREHRWVVINDAFCKLLGLPREALLGKSDPDLFPPEQVKVFWEADDALFSSGETNENEELLTDEQGVVHTIWTRKYPVRADDEVIGLVGIISDITTLRERLSALERLERTTKQQEARLEEQQALIDTIAVPVISVWDGILLVPLIGEVSDRRATLVLDRLLTAISRESARIVFLDISGVPSINEASAATLLRAISAARLLGARAEIVGVSAAVAQLLVELDVDLSSVTTHSTLRDGLRRALHELGARAR